MNNSMLPKKELLLRRIGLVIVIFSKDRPLQLGGTIQSFMLQCQDSDTAKVNILYKASSPVFEHLYVVLKKEYSNLKNIKWIREHEFKNDLLSIIHSYGKVLFLVDDNIFVREFYLSELCSLLNRHNDALGVSLRLGENTTYCYPLDKAQELPLFTKVTENIMKYSWLDAQCDFAYPLEVSSSIYRISDIGPFISNLVFNNPNGLEEEMAIISMHFSKMYPFLLCPKLSIAFCNPINKVQNIAKENRAGNRTDYSPNKLARIFAEGKRFDVETYKTFIPNACHQEVDLILRQKGINTGSLRKKKPLVSVIIPCYNQAEFLQEAVESVINQTYRNFEIIIIDDGSPDNTSEVADQLIKMYPDQNINLIRKENGGVTSARNAGISSSKGRYILPLDADDKIHSEMIEKCMNLLEENPNISIVYTDLIHFGLINKEVRAGEYSFKDLCKANQLNYCSLFRREAWKAAGGYNNNMILGYEDWDFWVSCGEKGYIAKRIPEALFYYRVKEASRDTTAIQHDLELKARIVLNHPDLYDKKTLLWAKRLIGNGLEADYKGKRPYVSVIIPTFNRPKMLGEALKSVLTQSYQEFEIVVINDAGVDVTDTINSLNEVAKIKYIMHENNKGLAAARNTGIRAAKGEYIAYLDDDDLFYPDHLETLIGCLEKHKYSVAYSDAYRAHQENQNGRYNVTKRDIPYSSDFNRDRILKENFIPALCIIHKKSCIDEVGYFDESLEAHEDWDLWMRMSIKFKFYHIEKITCEFSWRGDGTSMTSGREEELNSTRKIVAQRGRRLFSRKRKLMVFLRDLNKNIERSFWYIKKGHLITFVQKIVKRFGKGNL